MIMNKNIQTFKIVLRGMIILLHTVVYTVNKHREYHRHEIPLRSVTPRQFLISV